MSKLVTVSAKVPRTLKKRAHKLGINVSETLRDALAHEVEKRERTRLLDRLEQSSQKVLPRGTIVRLIKDMREEA